MRKTKFFESLTSCFEKHIKYIFVACIALYFTVLTYMKTTNQI
jgi:hypothetical protein